MTSQNPSHVSDLRHTPTPRRGFIVRLSARFAALAAGLSAFRLLAAAPADGHGGEVIVSQPGEDWMRSLTGKHRVAFDLSAHKNGKPLAQAKNYLDAWRDSFHIPEREINIVVGVHGEGIPIVLTDAVWSQFKIGQQYDVTDAGTKTAAVHNIFTAANAVAGGLVSAEQTVEALQRRGVRFIVCMNTIAGATAKLAAAGLGNPDEIRSALLGGLLPGVSTVPAMVVTLTQLQERGLAYIKIA